MNKRPILSVAIPTYNRVNFLETTVDRFVSQIEEERCEDAVEIVIGDDGSSDGTAEYLRKLEGAHPFVKTFSNAENLGVSGNVEKLAAMARGEFLWMVGEDDLIEPEALRRALESIRSDDPNVILLNTVNMISLDDRNLKYEIRGRNRLSITQDIFIESLAQDKAKFAALPNWLYLTNLISTTIIKKDLFVSLLPEAKKYMRPENVYLFQGPLLIGLSKFGRLKIIAQRCLLHRKNENHWSGKTTGLFRISLYDASEAVGLVKDYLPGEYKKYQKIFAVHTFTAIKRAKQKGEIVNRYILDAIKKYYSCFPYSIRFFIALLTPNAVFKYFIRS